MTQKVFISGIAGFLGSHLADCFSERGWRVCGIDNLFGGKEENLQEVRGSVDLQRADICDFDQIAGIVKGADVVFHEAALASVPRSVEAPLDTNAACVTGTVTPVHCPSGHVSVRAEGRDVDLELRRARAPCAGIIHGVR